MKKAVLALALALLLAGCAAPAGEVLTPPALAPGETETPAATGSPDALATGIVDEPPWFATFRVVAGAESGNLVLARNGDTADQVYTLNTEGLPLDRPVENGELINVYFETVLETFPAQFGGVTAVEHTKTDRDDRCGLYLRVLEDLWAADPGLNTDLEELGVDFSGLTDLSESEKSALAWVFGNAHGLTPITGTLEELWQAGCLTPMTEPAEGYEDSLALYCWENGCLFSLSGSAEEGFTARKWASGLGAYVFSDCTAQQNADGTWTYQVGSQAIS